MKILFQNAYLNFPSRFGEKVNAIINEYAGVVTTDEYQIGDTTYPNNTEVKFDLGSKMKVGTSKITITATADDCGSTKRDRNNIKTIIMSLNKDISFNARRVFNVNDAL